jgi:hypothetical protein
MSDKFEIKDFHKPLDTKAALEEAVDKLSTLGEYALIGGMAVYFYGLDRYTKDVDFAVSVETSGLAEEALKDLDLKPLRIGGISFLTTSGARADLIDHRFEYKALYEETLKAALTNGPRLRVADKLVPVVHLHYLVALKLISDRPKDEIDLNYLLAHPTLDYQLAREIVYRCVGPMPARHLDKLARLAGRLDTPKDYGEFF